MKVNNSTNINFRAGLTSQIKREIATTDVNKISRELFIKGINTDFKGNKVIAWSSLQCYRIIRALNNWYGLNLGLPNEIIVEDFNKLKARNKNATGFINMTPTKLYLNDDKVIPEKTIFFNEFKGFNYSGGNEYWNKIDEISDKNYETRFSTTDYFLEIFLHEFAHAAHEENLIQKLGGTNFVKQLQKTLNPHQLNIFRAKYENLLEKICTYATESPYEAVACDISKRAIENIDKNMLLPKTDFITPSPYRQSIPLKRLFIYEPETKLSKTLRRFWNGKME